MVKYMIKFCSRGVWYVMEQETAPSVVRDDVYTRTGSFPFRLHDGDTGRGKLTGTYMKLFANAHVEHPSLQPLPTEDVALVAMFSRDEWRIEGTGRAVASQARWLSFCQLLLNALADGYVFVSMLAERKLVTLARPVPAGQHPSAPTETVAIDSDNGRRAKVREYKAAGRGQNSYADMARKRKNPTDTLQPYEEEPDADDARDLLRKLERAIAGIDTALQYAVAFTYAGQAETVSWWIAPGVIDTAPETIQRRFPNPVISAYNVRIRSTSITPISSTVATLTLECPTAPTEPECKKFCERLFSFLAGNWFVHSATPAGVAIARYTDLDRPSARLDVTLARVEDVLNDYFPDE
jgi:hypothetical protein